MAKQQETLTEREQNIANQEAEMQKLRTEVSTFNQRLTAEIAQTREELTKSLEKAFANRLALIDKDRENEQKIAQLKTTHLEDLVRKQAQEIGQFRIEAEKTRLQSQNIALKLIESHPSARKAPGPEIWSNEKTS